MKETIGHSLARTVETDDYILTEIFVGDDTRARGYLITSRTDNVMMYFVDVDRINFRMTTENIATVTREHFDNINLLDRWLVTNEFDFIQIAQDFTPSNSNNGHPAFGWVYEQGPCGEGGAAPGYAVVYRNYYFAGFRIISRMQMSLADNDSL